MQDYQNINRKISVATAGEGLIVGKFYSCDRVLVYLAVIIKPTFTLTAQIDLLEIV